MAKKVINIADKETLTSVKDNLESLIADLVTTSNNISTIKSSLATINTNVANIKNDQESMENADEETLKTLIEIQDRLVLVETMMQKNTGTIREINDDTSYIKNNLDNVSTAMSAVSIQVADMKAASNRLTEDRALKIDSIGYEDDRAGSLSSGTVMAKINKLLAMITANFDNYNNIRAGYIDNIKENTDCLKGINFNEIRSVKQIQHGRINPSETLMLRKDSPADKNGNYVYYIDINLENSVNVNKCEIECKYFEGNTVVNCPTAIVDETTVRFYVAISNSGDNVIGSDKGYFWKVIEYV